MIDNAGMSINVAVLGCKRKEKEWQTVEKWFMAGVSVEYGASGEDGKSKKNEGTKMQSRRELINVALGAAGIVALRPQLALSAPPVAMLAPAAESPRDILAYLTWGGAKRTPNTYIVQEMESAWLVKWPEDVRNGEATVCFGDSRYPMTNWKPVGSSGEATVVKIERPRSKKLR